MTPSQATDLKHELAYTRDDECIAVVNRLKALLAAESVDPDLIRLMSAPLLYAVWERVFSLCTSICLQVVQAEYTRAGDCPPQARAFWLRKAGFFKSFVDAMREVMELEREDSVFQQSTGFKKKITKGTFNLSAKILHELDEWHAKPLQHSSTCADLVITYSNVNDAVVATNAEAIGLNALQSFGLLDLSRLGQLVGIRNGIGHGAILASPGQRELGELVQYTEALIAQYVAVANEWIDLHVADDHAGNSN